MDEIISYKMCAGKVRNAKLRNYLNHFFIQLAPGVYYEVYYIAWKATLSKYSILYSNWNGAIVLAMIILRTKLQNYSKICK
jgi:hypothetical protein